MFAGKDYDGAGKTGTAQSFSNGYETINLGHVGFAPFDNPEIAYAWVIPHVSTNPSRPQPGAQNDVAKQAVDKYFELKAKRAKENEATVTQLIKQAVVEDVAK